MENLEFILGALSMIGLFGLGYAVMGVFKVTHVPMVSMRL